MVRTFKDLEREFSQYIIYKSGDRKIVAIREGRVFTSRTIKDMAGQLEKDWNQKDLTPVHSIPNYRGILKAREMSLS